MSNLLVLPDLREMLESHRVNIDRAAAHLEAEH